MGLVAWVAIRNPCPIPHMVSLTEVTSRVRRALSVPRRANSSALQLPAMCEGVASQRRDARRQISDSGSRGNARRREGSGTWSGSCKKGCRTVGIREREEGNGVRANACNANAFNAEEAWHTVCCVGRAARARVRGGIEQSRWVDEQMYRERKDAPPGRGIRRGGWFRGSDHPFHPAQG